MGKGQIQLTAEELKSIITEAVVAGVGEYRQQQEQAKTVKKDSYVRNTKKLLDNYRKFKKHAGDVLDEQVEHITRSTFLYQKDLNELVVPSILESKQRTKAIVNFVDRMINEYRIDCETSDSIEMLRRYKAVQMLYLDDIKKSRVKIALELNISESTLYEDLKKAREELSVLIFGIDVIELNEAV